MRRPIKSPVVMQPDKVLQSEKGKLLVSTFWSSLSALADIPENYKIVGYELSAEDKVTSLIITQDNNNSQDKADHSRQNWKIVLEGIKKLIEDGNQQFQWNLKSPPSGGDKHYPVDGCNPEMFIIKLSTLSL